MDCEIDHDEPPGWRNHVRVGVPSVQENRNVMIPNKKQNKHLLAKDLNMGTLSTLSSSNTQNLSSLSWNENLVILA